MAADANVLLTHITTSAVTVAFLNWLKSTSLFPWINSEKPRLLRTIAVLLAGVKAVGITYTWNPSDHTLVIGGLTLSIIAAGVWHWLQSFAVQELIYRTTKNNAPPPPTTVNIGSSIPIPPSTMGNAKQ